MKTANSAFVFAKITVVSNHSASHAGRSAGFSHYNTQLHQIGRPLFNKQSAKNCTLWKKIFSFCFHLASAKQILSTGTQLIWLVEAIIKLLIQSLEVGYRVNFRTILLSPVDKHGSNLSAHPFYSSTVKRLPC